MRHIRSPDLSTTATAEPIWRAIARGEDGAEMDPAALAMLADLISSAGVVTLLPGAADHLSSGAVQQSRLLNRFRRLQGEQTMALLADANVPAMAIKGLASAHTVWPDPDARAVSDADILVPEVHLQPALTAFRDAGYSFVEVPTRGPWGFVGDASFQPLVGPGDASNIDLHIQGDAWPFARAVPAEELLTRSVAAGSGGFRAPGATDRFLIAASHAAGDLFGRDAIKSVVDGLLMLRQPDQIDFDDLRRRSERAHMRRPVTVWLALLSRLGADVSRAGQAGFRPESIGGAAFESVVAAHMRLFEGDLPLGALAKLRREASLCASLPVLLWRNGRRLTGLLKPRRGLPPSSRSS